MKLWLLALEFGVSALPHGARPQRSQLAALDAKGGNDEPGPLVRRDVHRRQMAGCRHRYGGEPAELASSAQCCAHILLKRYLKNYINDWKLDVIPAVTQNEDTEKTQ